jgi:hypothetical protein
MIPPSLIPLLKLHQQAQQAEKKTAGERWQDYDLVWSHSDGRPIDAGQDWDERKKLLRLAEVEKDARIHDARHTVATLLIEQGVDQRCSGILGHSQLTTTKRYAHITAHSRPKQQPAWAAHFGDVCNRKCNWAGFRIMKIGESAQVVVGRAPGARTRNLRIKSRQILCQPMPNYFSMYHAVRKCRR